MIVVHRFIQCHIVCRCLSGRFQTNMKHLRHDSERFALTLDSGDVHCSVNSMPRCILTQVTNMLVTPVRQPAL
jgi:hypothetical protein